MGKYQTVNVVCDLAIMLLVCQTSTFWMSLFFESEFGD